MTKKIQQTMLPIKLEQSPEKLTSLAGLVLVEEMARAKGLWGMVDEKMAGPGSGRGYKASQFIRPLVWMLTGGGRRLEDLRELRAEQGVLSKLGLTGVPDAGTTGDWLRRQGTRGGTEALEEINEKMVCEYLAKQGEELTLDPDATIIEANKREAQWTYKNIQGYQPMLAYVNEVCVHWEFREGNESAGSKAMEFLAECERKLPQGKRLYLRSDSAYYQGEVIARYSKPGRTFSITADQDSAVKEAIRQIPEDQWQKHYDKDGVETDRQIAETVHCMNYPRQAFRLIVLRWENPQPGLFEQSRYCHHAVATNRPETESASEVIRKHNGRGESENWHKELKVGYAMEQMPCGETAANAVYFGIGILAYNLGVLLKEEVLPVEYRKAKVATLRWQIYRLAGKLVRHGRQWTLKIKSDAQKLAALMSGRQRCYQLSG
jgi:Transposase DDE domain group 1